MFSSFRDVLVFLLKNNYVSLLIRLTRGKLKKNKDGQSESHTHCTCCLEGSWDVELSVLFSVKLQDKKGNTKIFFLLDFVLSSTETMHYPADKLREKYFK